MIQAGQVAEQIAGPHRECDDPWYSCPLSKEGCADDSLPIECRCGRDELVKRITDALTTATQQGREEQKLTGVCSHPMTSKCERPLVEVCLTQHKWLHEQVAQVEQAREHGRQAERERTEKFIQAHLPGCRCRRVSTGHNLNCLTQRLLDALHSDAPEAP